MIFILLKGFLPYFICDLKGVFHCMEHQPGFELHVLTCQYTKTTSFHIRPVEGSAVGSYQTGRALVDLGPLDPYSEYGSLLLYF